MDGAVDAAVSAAVGAAVGAAVLMCCASSQARLIDCIY